MKTSTLKHILTLVFLFLLGNVISNSVVFTNTDNYYVVNNSTHLTDKPYLIVDGEKKTYFLKTPYYPYTVWEKYSKFETDSISFRLKDANLIEVNLNVSYKILDINELASKYRGDKDLFKTDFTIGLQVYVFDYLSKYTTDDFLNNKVPYHELNYQIEQFYKNRTDIELLNINYKVVFPNGIGYSQVSYGN